jgi:hypothetical protein
MGGCLIASQGFVYSSNSIKKTRLNDGQSDPYLTHRLSCIVDLVLILSLQLQLHPMVFTQLGLAAEV